MYALVNCDIFTGKEFVCDKALLIEGKKIHGFLPEEKVETSIEKINLNGNTVAPGFIDVQVNGGGDTLFNDEPTVDAIKRIFDGHKKYGTTDFLPTFITGSNEGMQQAAESVNKCLNNNTHGVRGIHFEGPFIDESKAGVHDKKYIRNVNDTDVQTISSIKGGITLLTVASEKVPDEFITKMQKQGVLVSLGHTNATYQEANEGFAAGASCATHLFNAMTALSSRAPGVVGASLNNDKTWTGIIVDGFHVDYAAVQVVSRAKAARKLFLVTDAMPPVGGTGKGFRLGEYDISIENNKCITMGDVLAGSALDMASAVRNCIQHVGIDKGESLRMASTYPAEFLGLDNQLGYIQQGYDANLAIFNNQIRVSAVVIQGKYEEF